MTSDFVNAVPIRFRWNPWPVLVNWIKAQLDSIEITEPQQAQWVCQLIPAQCPFERHIRLGNRTLHIPAFCRINPVYDQLVALRMRAATFLIEVKP